MKISPRIFAVALVLLLCVSGGLVYAQSAAEKAYNAGMEDLQNNLVADAIKTLGEGIDAAQSGSRPLPDTDETITKMRYAYAYALAQDRRFFDAIPELDVLVASAPDAVEAKYLLGVTLIRSMSNENILRGLDALKQMADDNDDPDARTMAMRTSAQLGFNVATTEYAAGDPEAAAGLIGNVLAKYGQTPGKDKAENHDIHFALGVYLKDAGDVDGAMFELDYLARISKAKNYALKNGTTLSQVRAEVYYLLAIDRLEQGGEPGGRQALEMIAMLEKLEGADTPNRNFNTHAKALAHSLTGNSDAMKQELDTLKASNAAYFKSVTN